MEPSANPPRQTLLLLDRARAGDRDATSALFEHYLGRVVYLVRSSLHEPLRGRIETMDIVQDALVTACTHIKEFDPRSSGAFYSWMREIVKRKVNEAVKYYSAAKRKMSKEVPIGPTGSDDSGAGEWVPAISSLHLGSYFDRVAAVQRLEEQINALEAGQREALRLWYFEGLKPAEIAERMDRSADACRMMVARALKTLGRKFKESAGRDGA
jgi:RNA polymerase sigma-70 factor (subfamily 1)